MKPFTIYPKLSQQFHGQQEKLVSLILEIASPEAIYLIGASIHKDRTESIFCTDSPAAHYHSKYYLLLLISDLKQRPICDWQEYVEQHCKEIIPVTIIALETSTFKAWLADSHRFAIKIFQESVTLFAVHNTNFEIPSVTNLQTSKELDQLYNEGVNKATEFLAGAELFTIRNQNKMAAFMLHQAVEQSLRTLLKIGTGFHYNSHNLDRLIRYCCMISYKLPTIFPRHSDKEIKLFRLLQKAYIDARYESAFDIAKIDLNTLTERVKKILELTKECGKMHLISLIQKDYSDASEK